MFKVCLEKHIWMIKMQSQLEKGNKVIWFPRFSSRHKILKVVEKWLRELLNAIKIVIHDEATFT